MRMHRHEAEGPFLPGTEPGSAKERFARAFEQGRKEAEEIRQAHEQNDEPVLLRPEPREGLEELILREGKYYKIKWQTEPSAVDGKQTLKPIFADDQSEADALNQQLEERRKRKRSAASAEQPILRGVKRYMGKPNANGKGKGRRNGHRH